MKQIYAIDLFCGAGGLTYGLQKSGVRVNLGIDIDPNCVYPYSENNTAKFLLKSISELRGTELKRYFSKNDFSLLAGCAPCQTFSSYNQKATEKDPRWSLLKHFSRLIEESKPDFVTMENVPGLAKEKIFKLFLRKLSQNKYYFTYSVIKCEEYGIPQTRKRLVLLASRFSVPRLLKPSEFNSTNKTLWDTIGNLPKLEAGKTDTKDRLHIVSSLSEINLKRIRASKPGGTWRDWPKGLRAQCHKKATGKTYSGVYGRMRWDLPASTITTQFYGFGNGRFGHPDQNRALSLREGALIQGFPKKYKFIKKNTPISFVSLGRLIGNAVPVNLGILIGKSLKQHIAEMNLG